MSPNILVVGPVSSLPGEAAIIGRQAADSETFTTMTDIASLIQQLYSDEANARRDATFDLIGGGGAVIEPLMPLLKDDDADVRYAAALVLDQLKHLVSPRLFVDAEAAVVHLVTARRRLAERSVEDDKFVAVLIRQLLVRINTESARNALL